MKNPDETYAFVQDQLQSMWGEELSHRDIACDPDHDDATCYPAPFLKAIQSISLKNGWHCESLLLSIMNNVAFLEHQATRLTSQVGKTEQRLVDVPEITVDVPGPVDPIQTRRGRKRKGEEVAPPEDIEEVAEPVELDLHTLQEVVDAVQAVHVHVHVYVYGHVDVDVNVYSMYMYVICIHIYIYRYIAKRNPCPEAHLPMSVKVVWG